VSHDHHEPAPEGLDRRLWASAVLNLGITLVELAGGLWAGSLALLADAAHNFADVGALGLAIFARWLGRRPPTRRHTYGFRRAEVVAALINAAVLIAVSALIGREAVARFLNPAPPHSTVMLVAAAAALVANLASVALLHRHRAEDINVRSAFLHLAQDALASLAVFLAALLARTGIGPWVDPAVAVLIGLVVLRSAFSIVWEALNTLLEAAPADVPVEELASSVARRFSGVELHHLHVWEVGPGQRVLTAHMKTAVTSLPEAESIAAAVRGFLLKEWNIQHVTLEAEANGCGEKGLLGQWK
jgi:cobalt-zinc-cadmium efflux system protein